jgi:uracil-DNA glycosylase
MIFRFLDPLWKELLQSELEKPYIEELNSFLNKQPKSLVYPKEELIFNAFHLTPFEKIRVVIVGQDPYHGKGQAHGLAFSVPEGVIKPPSLLNIFKEVERDIGSPIPKNGSLVRWAKQGVFLLNTTLTVKEGEPLSHKGKGWETFTTSVIDKIGEKKEPVIFLLWGRLAQEKGERITKPHKILKAPHPSPLSAHRGFLGCSHFSQVNAFLRSLSQEPILW